MLTLQGLKWQITEELHIHPLLLTTEEESSRFPSDEGIVPLSFFQHFFLPGVLVQMH